MSNRFYLDYHHFEAKMPVPTWDCPELVLLDEQQSEGITTTNVVSEDIWKKFDLDFPQPFSLSMDRYYGGIEDGLVTDPYERSMITTSGVNSTSSSFGLLHGYEKSGSSLMIASSTSSRMQEAREIRHHDCMWAGLCISKEHNRTHPTAAATKKNKDIGGHIGKRGTVPAGRSLLINRKQPTNCNQTITAGSGLAKNLESDGDSTRPETPQSCESESEEEEEEEGDEEDDEEDEIPRFKHDSISINDKLSEYLVGDAAPVSEVTGQLIVSRKIANRDGKKIGRNTAANQFRDQQQQYNVKREKFNDDGISNNSIFYKNNQRNEFNRNSNTGSNYSKSNAANCTTNIVSLGDHCYHLNQTNSNSKKLEHLGVQTPSDSEEEIDVVTFDKPSFRPASSLPTNPSLADKQHFQKTVTSALKDKSSSSSSSSSSPPRPRGRPPSNNLTPRKRSAQNDQKPAKRARHKNSYQKRKPHANNNNNNNNNSKTMDKNENNNNNNINNSNKTNQRLDNNNCSSRVTIANESSNELIDDYYNNGDGITRIGDIKLERNEIMENNNNNNSNNSNNSSNNNSCSSNNNNNSNNTSSRGTTTTKSSNSNSSISNNSSYGMQSTSSRSGTTTSCSDDEPETEKRSLHNNMERQRRIELRNAFEELRVLVPEVEMKEKAPKVVILRQAAVYCDMLNEIEQNTLATVNELKKRQDRLRTKLSQLRRNFRTERRGAEVRNYSNNHHIQLQHQHHHHQDSRRGSSGLQG